MKVQIGYIHAVNRGGLCLVSESTDVLFHKLELLINPRREATKGYYNHSAVCLFHSNLRTQRL